LINVAKIEHEPAQMSQLIKLMDTSAEKLDKIVIDLIETLGIRDMSVKKQELDLKVLVEEILIPYKEKLNNNLKFIIENDFKKKFASDKGILSMVLKRIIDNAVKYHNYAVPGGYISVKLRTDEKGASISVSDNGHGIKEELLDRVFDMFFRANNDSDGSGLGLYLAKVGTEKLGGNISLHSMHRIGTTVQLQLPS
jgi:signal transduction histidine kinase